MEISQNNFDIKGEKGCHYEILSKQNDDFVMAHQKKVQLKILTQL